MNLKENLKNLLGKHRLNLSELSKSTGISVKTLHNWTTGQEPRKLSQVKTVADFFNITVDELCFDLNETPEVENKIKEHQDEIRAGIFEVVLRPIKTK